MQKQPTILKDLELVLVALVLMVPLVWLASQHIIGQDVVIGVAGSLAGALIYAIGGKHGLKSAPMETVEGLVQQLVALALNSVPINQDTPPPAPKPQPPASAPTPRPQSAWGQQSPMPPLSRPVSPGGNNG